MPAAWPKTLLRNGNSRTSPTNYIRIDSAGEDPLLVKGDYNRSVAPLAGGYRVVWDRGEPLFLAKRPYLYRFRGEDGASKQADKMESLMGMLGHAALVPSGRGVFAPMHPSTTEELPRRSDDDAFRIARRGIVPIGVSEAGQLPSHPGSGEARRRDPHRCIRHQSGELIF
jgi:hypothetical protein